MGVLMTTPNMLLEKPTPMSTLGPAWADQINAIIDKIDAHDHTPGDGVQLNQSALNINGDFEVNNQRITEVKALSFQNQAADVAFTNGFFVQNFNLYYKNSFGSSIQITNGNQQFLSGEIGWKTVTTPTYTVVNSDRNTVIGYNLPGVIKTVTLPLISTVGVLHIIFRDIAGDANAFRININVTGSDRINGDVLTTYPLDWGHGTLRLISDGISRWYTYV